MPIAHEPVQFCAICFHLALHAHCPASATVFCDPWRPGSTCPCVTLSSCDCLDLALPVPSYICAYVDSTRSVQQPLGLRAWSWQLASCQVHVGRDGPWWAPQRSTWACSPRWPIASSAAGAASLAEESFSADGVGVIQDGCLRDGSLRGRACEGSQPTW